MQRQGGMAPLWLLCWSSLVLGIFLPLLTFTQRSHSYWMQQWATLLRQQKQWILLDTFQKHLSDHCKQKERLSRLQLTDIPFELRILDQSISVARLVPITVKRDHRHSAWTTGKWQVGDYWILESPSGYFAVQIQHVFGSTEQGTQVSWTQALPDVDGNWWGVDCIKFQWEWSDKGSLRFKQKSRLHAKWQTVLQGQINDFHVQLLEDKIIVQVGQPHGSRIILRP